MIVNCWRRVLLAFKLPTPRQLCSNGSPRPSEEYPGGFCHSLYVVLSNTAWAQTGLINELSEKVIHLISFSESYLTQSHLMAFLRIILDEVSLLSKKHAAGCTVQRGVRKEKTPLTLPFNRCPSYPLLHRWSERNRWPEFKFLTHYFVFHLY